MTRKFHWYLPTHGDTATVADNQGSAAQRGASHLEPTLANLRRAHERFRVSGSEGQRRMAALTTGALVSARSLEIRPGLWAGPSLLRDGAGTAAIGSYAEVAAVFDEYAAVG